jgi:putative selenate reductase molybdopterin-binding subunit
MFVISRLTHPLHEKPRLVKGQVEGGFAQGVGFALTELYPGGPLGGQRLTNFDGYALPRLSGLPPGGVRTIFVDLPASDGVLHPIGTDDPAPPPPQRKKGIAEISITPVAPAIANAIFHAVAARPAGGTLATRLLDLPISPAAVRRVLQQEPP